MPVEQDPVVAAYDAIRNAIHSADLLPETEVTAAFRGLNFLLDEVNRLTDENAALRAPIEWEIAAGGLRFNKGNFQGWLQDSGWSLRFKLDNYSMLRTVAFGIETGTIGKVACIAAYLKAIGIPSTTT